MGPMAGPALMKPGAGWFLLLAVACGGSFQEAYPCDRSSALALAAECGAKYQACKSAGHPDACPEADACEVKGIERERLCVDRIRSGK